MFNEVIVVEGIHDMMKIKEVLPNAEVIITNGREISESTLKMIEKISKQKGIILFLDPDAPGEKIRQKINALVPKAKHAFLPKEFCISENRKKVGIEHAPKELVLDALSNLLTPKDKKNEVVRAHLYELGLIGQQNSKKLRDAISLELNIGQPNAKTFLNRVQMFDISLNQLKELVQKYEK